MSLHQRLDDDLKRAIKSSDKLKTSVLRMVKAAIKNRHVEKQRELSEEEIISVILTLSKQRRESIDLFLKGGREDLADKEKQEISILQTYLPSQLPQEEIDRLIIESIQESSAEGVKDIGKVMRLLMPKVRGTADGKMVNQRVKELLEKV
ncbi:MAG: glutamyl-tRNA amidotransferase [Nitrospirae bacterium RBG_13_43_8]|nr:MAG: glutamyl-tRNA amidotransferase [Nitrospirae bacterium RBG_13_43_8]